MACPKGLGFEVGRSARRVRQEDSEQLEARCLMPTALLDWRSVGLTSELLPGLLHSASIAFLALSGRQINSFTGPGEPTRASIGIRQETPWESSSSWQPRLRVDSDALERLFAPHGAVESAAVITDRGTGRSKG